MFSTADLQELVCAVKQWSLQRILGAVRVDNSRYGSPLKGPGWMWDDDPDEYNMSVTPLMLDFNVLTVRVSAAEGRLSATLVPRSDYPPIRLTASDGQSHDVRVTRQPFQNHISVTPGQLNGASRDFRLTMHEPALWAAGVLRAMLEDQDVIIQDAQTAALQPHAGTPNIAALPSIRHEGSTLSEAIAHLLQVSENAVGEVLLHEIALANGASRPTWPDGAQAITNWLTQTAGLVPGSFRLVDGSGLSRYNLISADSSVQLLKYMHGHPQFDAFSSRSRRTRSISPMLK